MDKNSRFYRYLHNVQIMFFRCAYWMEVLIAMLILVGCLKEMIGAPEYLVEVGNGGFDSFLQYLFDILIGVEMIKMLCRQDLDAMVEVLLFAVARYLIIGHRTVSEFLIGITAIGGLFAIRKFLFIPHKQKEEEWKNSDYLQKEH